MSKARLVITALFVDHQSPAEVAARYGVHRAWVYKLKARYEAEGESALEPRSRRPNTSPAALSHELVDLIVRVRKELTDAGLDAGPETIAWHLEHHHGHQVSRSTISRHLTRAGLRLSLRVTSGILPGRSWLREVAHEVWTPQAHDARASSATPVARNKSSNAPKAKDGRS
jgi:transposase